MTNLCSIHTNSPNLFEIVQVYWEYFQANFLFGISILLVVVVIFSLLLSY